MHAHAVLVALALILAPLGASAADLVVWWEKGLSAQEDEAVREIIAAFEEKTGKQVELVQPSNADFPATAEAAVSAGQPPDFLFGLSTTPTYYSQWTYEDRLVDLSDEIQPFASLFDPDAHWPMSRPVLPGCWFVKRLRRLILLIGERQRDAE